MLSYRHWKPMDNYELISVTGIMCMSGFIFCVLCPVILETIYWKDYLCSIVLPLFLCQRSLDYIYVGLFLDSTLSNGKFVYSLQVPLLEKITIALQWFLKADSVSSPTLFFSINIVLAILDLLSPQNFKSVGWCSQSNLLWFPLGFHWIYRSI